MLRVLAAHGIGGLCAHLLQRGRAELNSDVVELPVLLSAEVAHDMWVLV